VLAPSRWNLDFGTSDVKRPRFRSAPTKVAGRDGNSVPCGYRLCSDLLCERQWAWVTGSSTRNGGLCAAHVYFVDWFVGWWGSLGLATFPVYPGVEAIHFGRL